MPSNRERLGVTVNTSLFTIPDAVKSSMLRARGKASLFPARGARAHSAPRAPRLTGYAVPPTRVRTDHEDDSMRTAFAPAGQADPPAKPKGGYRIIGAAVMAAAWWAYRRKLIRLVDLRVWFAAHEMDARRCRIEQDFTPKFSLRELKRLTGLSVKRLKDSLRRLQAVGLLSWSETALDFPDSADFLAGADADDFATFLDQIPNSDRKLPVPRRILRLLAGGARPALIATVVGHLIRGLYLKSGKCHDRGRVKASWIAEVFGVSLRRVKHARQELIAGGWLISLDADQWALNRWGAHFRINLEWSRLDATNPVEPKVQTPQVSGPVFPESEPKSAPPPPAIGPKTAPPDSYGEPPTGSEKNQKPASGRPAGISISEPEEVRAQHVSVSVPLTVMTTSVTPSSVRPESIPPALAPVKPDFRNVVIEDLKDVVRLLMLFGQAIALGLVTSSERDRLRFVAAAEHARVIGTTNPCGLFVRLIRNGLWPFLTRDDEDTANRRLKRHLYGKPPERKESPPFAVTETVKLSEDARLVQAIRAALARTKYQGDGFAILRRERPEWTRERWDRALAELEQTVRYA